MRRDYLAPGILVGCVGAVFGWSLARVVSTLSTFVPEPGHYRVEGALSKLSGVLSLPSTVWIVGVGIVCVLLWRLMAGVLAAQRRIAGVSTAALVSLPLTLAVAINLSVSDPTKHSGQLWLTAGVGFAVAGTAIVASYVILWPAWSRTDPWRQGARFVWGMSILLHLVLGFWMSTIMEPTGDEPHYLLGMHSITHDGDLDVANNHADQDYLNFYPTEIHNAQMIATRQGITLPKHSLGLMILGAPFYALGGRVGVSILTSLVSAAFAGVIFQYVSRVRNSSAGILAWSGLLMSAPLVLYPGQIYPNALTGLLIGLALMSSMRRAVQAQVLGGLALGLVPWFHLGTWPLAAGALVLIIYQERKRGLLMGLVACASWLALLSFHLHFWGAATPPVATYGNFAFSQVPAALAGQFLDQEAGILWIAPLLWFVVPGTIVSLRGGIERAQCLLLLGWLLYISSFNWWHGGWCPTGRFLLPVLVLLAVALPEMVHRFRRLAAGLWIASGLASVVLIAFPFFRYNAHDGSHAVLDAAGPLGEAVASLLPSVVAARPVAWLFWILVMGVATWFGVRRRQNA